MRQLKGWKFDEMEGKSTATKKPNSYPSQVLHIVGRLISTSCLRQGQRQVCLQVMRMLYVRTNIRNYYFRELENANILFNTIVWIIFGNIMPTSSK
jgi:hypothetical protein